jgi:hypothetical protein
VRHPSVRQKIVFFSISISIVSFTIFRQLYLLLCLSIIHASSSNLCYIFCMFVQQDHLHSSISAAVMLRWLPMLLSLTIIAVAAHDLDPYQQQSGWGVNNGRTNMIDVMPPLPITSVNQSEKEQVYGRLAIMGRLTTLWPGLRRELCYTGRIPDMPPQPVRVPIMMFNQQSVATTTATATASSSTHIDVIWVLVDGCVDVNGLSLFGLSPYGNGDVVYHGYWPSITTGSVNAVHHTSWAWLINSTSIAVIIKQGNRIMVGVVELPRVIDTSTNVELAAPSCANVW